MNYSEYTGADASAAEYTLTVSDGVILKIIDFTPVAPVEGKPVIIFIAGWISLISGWKDFLSAATPHYRIIYVETREKESSFVPDIKKTSFRMPRMRDDIRDVIQGIIPEETDFVLAGSSLGASAIMEYCMSKYRMPVCTALVGPNAGFRFPLFLGSIIPLVHPGMYFAFKYVIKWYLRKFRVNSEVEREQIEKYELTLDHADPYKLKKNALGIKRWSLPDSGRITAPSIIFGATTDSLHSTEHIKGLMSHFTDGKYVELASNKETHSGNASRIMMDYIESVINSPRK